MEDTNISQGQQTKRRANPKKMILAIAVVVAVIAGLAMAALSLTKDDNQASAPAAVKSGIEGKIIWSPCREGTCYQMAVIVQTQDHSSEITRVSPDQNGKFGIDLEPGIYAVTIQSNDPTMRAEKETVVSVVSGQRQVLNYSFASHDLEN